MGTEEGASHSTFGVREEITASADSPPQLSSAPPVVGVVIDDSSPRSLGAEHIEHRPPDSIVLERSAVSHTPSCDVEVSSSPTLGLPIGMLLPLNLAIALSDNTFLCQNLVLRCQPPPLVVHLVHGIRVLLLREARMP